MGKMRTRYYSSLPSLISHIYYLTFNSFQVSFTPRFTLLPSTALSHLLLRWYTAGL